MQDLTEVVLPQYKKGFERLMAEPEELDYRSLKWSDSEIEAGGHGARGTQIPDFYTGLAPRLEASGPGCTQAVTSHVDADRIPGKF